MTGDREGNPKQGSPKKGQEKALQMVQNAECLHPQSGKNGLCQELMIFIRNQQPGTYMKIKSKRFERSENSTSIADIQPSAIRQGIPKTLPCPVRKSIDSIALSLQYFG